MSRPIIEGKVKKGGINVKPSTPRPAPPKGQGFRRTSLIHGTVVPPADAIYDLGGVAAKTNGVGMVVSRIRLKQLAAVLEVCSDAIEKCRASGKGRIEMFGFRVEWLNQTVHVLNLNDPREDGIVSDN